MDGLTHTKQLLNLLCIVYIQNQPSPELSQCNFLFSDLKMLSEKIYESRSSLIVVYPCLQLIQKKNIYLLFVIDSKQTKRVSTIL